MFSNDMIQTFHAYTNYVPMEKINAARPTYPPSSPTPSESQHPFVPFGTSKIKSMSVSAAAFATHISGHRKSLFSAGKCGILTLASGAMGVGWYPVPVPKFCAEVRWGLLFSGYEGNIPICVCVWVTGSGWGWFVGSFGQRGWWFGVCWCVVFGVFRVM
ncbi:hypothetical protein BDU57DRAFT_28055 [Ampelomyces quisqualis]|uniref:Uncharacterized protein n=1 Tax=Ampelomyces quisqualis TaxID=50730 RepID=A0A6A5QYJ3_AMPQU|nr:hypothetical protein BDU57DRAFT_28055 [Ampelomyces quisqualis]